MIIISHSHADGTTVAGSRRGDGVWEIVRQHGFRYSRSVGIYLHGSRDRDAQTGRIDAAAQALRGNGFDVTVQIDDQWRPAEQREQAAAERADERADRYSERADAAAGGDRSRRDRALTNLDRAIDEGKNASRLAGRADAVRAHAGRKENPRLVMRRIETLSADLRRWERELNEATSVETASDAYQHRVRREIGRLTENIAHQQAKLDEHAAEGTFVAWGPQNLAKGDHVRGEFGWYMVSRVSRKSVSLDRTDWPQRLTFDRVYGRRRDGMQLDTPAGVPWPVELAQQVARWQLAERRAVNPGYDQDAQRHARHVGYARRLVHGLDLDAHDRQVAAFWPTAKTPEAVAERRRLSAAYLAVLDRLEADERVPDIIASLTPDRRGAAWVMPDGDPVDRKPQQLKRGDIIAGLWDTGARGRELWPHFQGPVEHVSDPVAHDGRDWVVVTLSDGAERELATTGWLAVHPAV